MKFQVSYSFENTEWDKDWCYLRIPNKENYKLDKNKLILKGIDITFFNCMYK